jgi:integrase
VEIKRVWERVREEAGLTEVRLHDLRHSFASVAASGGASLVLIGALLGHRVPASTARYAHLTDDARKSVANRTAQDIAASMAASESQAPRSLRALP